MEFKSGNSKGDNTMKRNSWTDDKLKLVKAYLEQKLTIMQIAQKMNLSYKAVEHAIHMHGLRSQSEYVQSKEDITTEKIKLTRDAINTTACEIATQLYEQYKVVALREPTVKKNDCKREEVSILDLSDVHLGSLNTVIDGDTGKKLVTYNEEIFQQELQTLQDSITEIHEILSHSYNLKKLVIFVLGDILTNDRIFEGQIFEIEKVVGLQLWDGVNYFTQFFNNLLKLYETIEIVCVVGNHGRSQPMKDSDNEPVENNFEYHLYRIWEKQFAKSKRVKFFIAPGRRAFHDVNGWKHCVEHGDAIKGMSEQAVIKQVKELYINTKFDVFEMGHFHQIKEIEVSDQIIAKINGAWVAKDNYAFRKFKTYSVPKQWFYGCNKSRPETWSYKLDLRSKE